MCRMVGSCTIIKVTNNQRLFSQSIFIFNSIKRKKENYRTHFSFVVVPT